MVIYMNKIVKLLDCTLRDGGYVNDWRFGYNTIVNTIERLAVAGVDVIEVGFLDDRQKFDINRTIQPDTGSFDKILENVDRGQSLLFGMIDYGTCDITNIAPCSQSTLDGIRVIFKRPKMREAIAFSKQLIDLGYFVSLNMVSITSYSDRDILDFSNLANEIQPFAVSMVDTYGLMHKEEMLNYFFLLDHNLDKRIQIGYHSHNNFQLAYANTCELVKRNSTHALIVDGALYGMGKSAGNAPLELLAMYLNENYEKQYNINQILEIIDSVILRIYQKHYWGYNLLYFISANSNCHPNYVNYLLKKNTLSVPAINKIIGTIPEDSKLNYSQPLIEQLYVMYQGSINEVRNEKSQLNHILHGQKVLLLGPGKSISEEHELITETIQKEKPIIFAVNFIPKEYPVNYIFISNSKRYALLTADFKRLPTDVKVVATSNVVPIKKGFDYVLNYADLIDQEKIIEDNAFIMLLKYVCSCQVKSIYLAGFDGFRQDPGENYYDEDITFSSNFERLLYINRAVAERIPHFRKEHKISFLTPSLYDAKE